MLLLLVIYLTDNIVDVSTSFQGLFVTDLPDHYPIFHIDRQMWVKESEMFMYKRIFSPSNIYLFYRSLSETDWSEIYRTFDTQKAFDQFTITPWSYITGAFLELG